ncbi:DUF2167 domain-containing protein [Akkermansiaceae bacterium]|nr:DUF2167 domain-containing protein [Akkermansiaceae bacterium]MDB4537855.1 DUF2167 domain-containing protein [Akkermansiaceae bacterium]
MIIRKITTLCFSTVLTFSGLCHAQETPVAEEASPLDKYHWITSGEGQIGSHATIKIPEGFRFLKGRETAEVMEYFGNLPSQYDGMIGPDSLDWFVIFQFSDTGYVDDSEKEDLDADELFKILKEGQEEANKERKRLGIGTLTLTGWAAEPNYNESTNNLEWGLTLVDSEGFKNVNFLTKLLGRRGVMETTLICDTEDLDAVLPVYQNLIADFEYSSGNTYAEYEEGDKLAEYGLKGLIAGGAIYGAAKLGFFAFLKKGFKFIIAGVVAVGLFLKRLITGKSAQA